MGPRLASPAKNVRVREGGHESGHELGHELGHAGSRTDFAVEFGREICGELEIAGKREWIVTNGLGGFASGSIAGMPTRRYHGLLIAALKPPLGRTLLVAHLEETVECDGRKYELSTCRWSGGAVSPSGYRNIEAFRLEGTTPVWTFACGGALIEKRIWMEQGANTTYVTYRLARQCNPVALEIKALVNYRDYHASTHAGAWRMNVEPRENGVRVTAFDGAVPFYLSSASAAAEPAHEWYRDFDLAAERYRGLDDREDHLHAATFRASLSAGQTLTIVGSTEALANLDGGEAYRVQKDYENSLAGKFAAANSPDAGAPSCLDSATGAGRRSVCCQPAAS